MLNLASVNFGIERDHPFLTCETGERSTSADIRDTDFFGGRAGRLSCSAARSALVSSTVPEPLTAKVVGTPPELREGSGGGMGVELLSAGLDA